MTLQSTLFLFTYQVDVCVYVSHTAEDLSYPIHKNKKEE